MESRRLSIDSIPPPPPPPPPTITRVSTPSPNPRRVSVINHQTRSRSVEPSHSPHSYSGANIVCIAPSSTPSRSRSHSGSIYTERRSQSAKPDSPKRQTEYLQIRSSSSRSRSSNRLEWVQTRRSNSTSSTSQARSRSRGRPVVRDRIVEVVEPPPSGPSLYSYQEPAVFDPSIHTDDDYFNHAHEQVKIVVDMPIHHRGVSATRSPSVSSREESISTATSSMRSTKSAVRQSVFNLEKTASRSPSTSRDNGYHATDKASMHSGKGSSYPSTLPGDSPDSSLRRPSALKTKYRYTPTLEKDPSSRTYNRLKLLKGCKSDNLDPSKDNDEDEVEIEDRKLRRILKLGNRGTERNRSVSTGRRVSILEEAKHRKHT